MAFVGQSRGTGLSPIRPRVLAGRKKEEFRLTDVTGSIIEIRDPTIITQKLAVDANGKIGVSSLPNVSIASIAAGTTNIGDVDVASIAAGDNNIGNVDVATIAAGDNNIGNVDVVTLPTVTLASQASPFSTDIKITLDSEAIVLGAGTAAIGKLAANNGVDIGDVDIKSIAAGTNNIGDVDIASALPAGTNAIGKLAANSGVDIGDVDVASIATGSNIIGAVKRDIVNYTKFCKYVALSTTGETTVWDPTAGKKFVITDLFVSATAAGTCTLKDGTAGTTFQVASLAANGGFVSNLQTPIQSATADNNLTATASAATQYITVCGYEV
jgi:hypothetical protein